LVTLLTLHAALYFILSGVFGITLSGEYRYVSETYNLDRIALANMAVASFQYAFVPDDMKVMLQASAKRIADNLLASTARLNCEVGC
jgi:hypothetical protein